MYWKEAGAWDKITRIIRKHRLEAYYPISLMSKLTAYQRILNQSLYKEMITYQKQTIQPPLLYQHW